MILLLGYRKGVLSVLLKRQLPVVLWDEGKLPEKVTKQVVAHIQSPFSSLPALSKQLRRELRDYHFTAILAVVERAVMLAAQLRDWLEIDGITPAVAARCHDKLLMKRFARQNGLPVTPYCWLLPESSLKYVRDAVHLPMVVKPRLQSGCRGMKFITNVAEELPVFLTGDYLAEQYIHGQEYSIESFVVNHRVVFSNITEYFQLRYSNIVPATLDQALSESILALNQKIVSIYNVANGITHVEIYISDNKDIVFGELAIRPPGGYLMTLLALTYGFDPWECYVDIELGLGDSAIFSNIVDNYSGVVLFHPGEGVVKSILGQEVIQAMPEVRDFGLRCKVGDHLQARVGAGQDYGKVIITGNSRTEIVASMAKISEQFAIVLDRSL